MKFIVKKVTLVRFFKLLKQLKWRKLTAKLAVVCAAIAGAFAAVSGSATTGVALSSASATAYAASKGLSAPRYEKTKHVPPGRVDKAANMQRQREIGKSRRDKTPNAGNAKVISQKALSPKQAMMGNPLASNGGVSRIARKK